MPHSHTVTQMNAMMFARPSAVGVILPIGEESGEDTVLHMEHRHVLVDRQFEPFGRSRSKKVEDLTRVQIIADRYPVEALRHEELSAQRVGNIKGKVTHRK